MKGAERLRDALTLPRIWRYRALSTCRAIGERPIVHQPLLLLGPGRIAFGEDVRIGWPTSPGFHNGYVHIEAAAPGASVRLGRGVELNNGAYVKSDGAGIEIGDEALIGSGVTIVDSDFHDLHPARRRDGTPRTAAVVIGPNVFVGDGVRILKGVTIGADAVIGAGSVVTGPIPAGVVAAGNPARIVRALEPVGDAAASAPAAAAG